MLSCTNESVASREVSFDPKPMQLSSEIPRDKDQIGAEDLPFVLLPERGYLSAGRVITAGSFWR